ncbi:hypothetical protein BKA64DRAFT_471552 [Cadophora sp. MPI-SDFR-AT-0126]|nr:hypothetical protein BKA64DRAFT_471552 [Leotiomycetes sp. MPI-SDFR-AT-0126]
MSTHEKKAARASNLRTNKSPIATPPRAALHGRSKTDHSAQQQVTSDNVSTKSGREGSGAVAGVGGADTTSTSPASETEDSASISSISISLPTHSRDLLHEKDRKIADLERELSVMESEFSAELTTLSHKLTNESETVQFWQQKHSSLNQTFLQTDTDLRLLKQEIAGFAEAREERERDIKTRISSLILDRDAFREAYNEAMGEVRAKEEMVRMLQGQVRGLKSWVSSSSKVGEQVSDEVFGEEMRRLGNGLQNWVITHFRRVRIDTSRAPDATLITLEQIVPTYESLASSSKIHLIQSFVSRLLVTHVFSVYFVGLAPEQANDLANVDKTLSGFGSAESMNQWRSTTLSILRKESQKLQSATTAVIDGIVSQVNNIMDGISDTKHTEMRDQALRSIISSSIELSRQLRVQKAVFSVIMPSIVDYQKTMFDSDSMEDIGGEDEDSLSDREIRCVTFPGIVKAGDENGERSHLRNVVAKIRVLCAPD